MYAGSSPVGIGLFINNNLLNEYNLTEDFLWNKNNMFSDNVYNTNLYELQNKGKWNWEKLGVIIDRLKNKTDEIYAFPNNEDFLRQLIFSNEGNFISGSEKEKKIKFNIATDNFKEAIDFYNKLKEDRLILDKFQGESSFKIIGLKEGDIDISTSLNTWSEIIFPNLTSNKFNHEVIEKINNKVEEKLIRDGYSVLIE